MAENSKIEWTSATWNPTVGCSVTSPGCTNCYAMRMAGRLEAMGNPIYRGHTIKTKAGHVWNGKVAASNYGQMIKPLSWKKPRLIFVNSMSDVFHEDMPDEVIDQVFAVMSRCPQHTFQLLTKRSARMRAYFAALSFDGHYVSRPGWQASDKRDGSNLLLLEPGGWPLPNVWLGVSVEDQERANERIPDLLGTPAAIRFLSAEPLLGPIDIAYACKPHWASGGVALIHQVIVGGESGPRSRLCWTPHIRSIVEQCQRSNVAVFVKQLGANVQDRNDAGFDGCEPHNWPDMDPFNIEHDLYGISTEYQGAPVRVHLKSKKGGDPAEWPEDLRVREMPVSHKEMPR